MWNIFILRACRSIDHDLFCLNFIDGLEMPAEWLLGVMLPTFKWKNVVMDYNCNRNAILHEDSMSMVERVLKKVLNKI